MEMKNLKMGLCQGRHDIANVKEYIFDKEVDPTDLEGMNEQVHAMLQDCNSLELYVTGLSVALVTVINYCCQNHIPLVLWHYDRETGEYYSQFVKTQVDCDILWEGGYIPQDKNLKAGCM